MSTGAILSLSRTRVHTHTHFRRRTDDHYQELAHSGVGDAGNNNNNTFTLNYKQ